MPWGYRRTGPNRYRPTNKRRPRRLIPFTPRNVARGLGYRNWRRQSNRPFRIKAKATPVPMRTVRSRSGKVIWRGYGSGGARRAARTYRRQAHARALRDRHRRHQVRLARRRLARRRFTSYTRLPSFGATGPMRGAATRRVQRQADFYARSTPAPRLPVLTGRNATPSATRAIQKARQSYSNRLVTAGYQAGLKGRRGEAALQRTATRQLGKAVQTPAVRKADRRLAQRLAHRDFRRDVQTGAEYLDALRHGQGPIGPGDVNKMSAEERRKWLRAGQLPGRVAERHAAEERGRRRELREVTRQIGRAPSTDGLAALGAAQRPSLQSAHAWKGYKRTKLGQWGEVKVAGVGVKLPRMDLNALRVLEELGRVNHAIAGGVKYYEEGDNPLKGFTRGLADKDRYTFADTRNVQSITPNRTARAVIGLGMDIGSDPLTYVSAGAKPVGEVIGKGGAAIIRSGGKGAKGFTGAGRVARQMPALYRKHAYRVADEAEQAATARIARTNASRARRGVRPLTEAGQRSIRRQARNSAARNFEAAALKRHGKTRGIQLGMFGQRTSGRLTAKGARTIPVLPRYNRAARKFEGKTLSDIAEATAHSRVIAPLRRAFDPDYKRPGRTDAEHSALRGEGRTLRQRKGYAQRVAAMLAADISRRHPNVEDQIKIADAIEAEDIASLPKELRRTASAVVRKNDEMYRAERGAGIAYQGRRGYIPHIPALQGRQLRRVVNAIESGEVSKLPPKLRPHAERLLEDGIRRSDFAGSPGGGKLSYAKRRSDERTLRQLDEEGLNPYERRLDRIMGERALASRTKVAEAQFLRNVAAKSGPRVKPGGRIPEHYAGTHGIYRVTDSGIRPASPDDVKLIEDAAGLRKQLVAKHGRVEGLRMFRRKTAELSRRNYRLLSHRHVKDIDDELRPHGAMGERSEMGMAWDKAHGMYKATITQPMPSYHLRNLYGDIWNAAQNMNVLELGQALKQGRQLRRVTSAMRQRDAQLIPGENVSRNLSVRGRTLRASKVRDDDAKRVFGLSRNEVLKRARTDGIKVGDQHIPYMQLAKEAQDAGVLGTGFSRDILEHASERGSLKGAGTFNRATQAREDVVRLASYIGARKQGLSVDESAQRVLKAHFDYADLTKVERSIRRWMGFYTFMARNTPFQAKSLVQRPGKYATINKTAEAGAYAANLPEDWRQRLKPYERQMFPIPLPGLGQDSLPILAFPGLPLTDLSRINLNLRQQFDQNVVGAVTGPKVLIEALSNYSFFFRDKINRGDYVPAPDWISSERFNQLRKIKVHGRPLVDWGRSQEGKKIPTWHPKLDYLIKSLPETNFGLSATTSAKNLRGQTPQMRTFGLATGVRPAPFDAISRRIDDASYKIEKIDGQLKTLRNRPGGAYDGDYYTPQYEALMNRQKDLRVKRRKLAERRLKRDGVPRRLWRELLPDAPGAQKRRRRIKRPKGGGGSGVPNPRDILESSRPSDLPSPRAILEGAR